VTAAARSRESLPVRFQYLDVILASGQVAWAGAGAVINLSTSKAQRGSSAPGLFSSGVFLEDVDASLGDKATQVDLERIVNARWWDNAAGGDAVLATQIGSLCYVFDDSTVTITATGRSVKGRVWAVSASKGVLVEEIRDAVSVPEQRLKTVVAAFAFTANDYAPTAVSLVSDSVVTVGTTAAASTVTLPDAAAGGTKLVFKADGSANGHTVTYRQAGGGTPVALTTALTAARRHVVEAYFSGTTWAVNAYVGPA
jgi:hypothetical protein